MDAIPHGRDLTGCAMTPWAQGGQQLVGALPVAHDDREPSLSISAGHEGKVLIYCHAGFDQWQVIAALRAHGLWDDAGLDADLLDAMGASEFWPVPIRGIER